MSKRTALLVVATLFVALVLFVVGALAFVYSGLYNVAATDAHLGVVRWVLNTTQERSVAVRADEVPARAVVTPEALAHGFEHYNEMCVACHGAPGVERGEFGKGMNPTPPDLAEEATEWTPEQLFWITKHGIKMAGMPAFGPTHTDEEIWGIVAVVERLPGLSAAEYAQWEEPFRGAGNRQGHGSGAGGEGGHRHGAREAGTAGGAGHTDSPGAPPHSH